MFVISVSSVHKPHVCYFHKFCSQPACLWFQPALFTVRVYFSKFCSQSTGLFKIALFKTLWLIISASSVHKPCFWYFSKFCTHSVFLLFQQVLFMIQLFDVLARSFHNPTVYFSSSFYSQSIYLNRFCSQSMNPCFCYFSQFCSQSDCFLFQQILFTIHCFVILARAAKDPRDYNFNSLCSQSGWIFFNSSRSSHNPLTWFASCFVHNSYFLFQSILFPIRELLLRPITFTIHVFV